MKMWTFLLTVVLSLWMGLGNVHASGTPAASPVATPQPAYAAACADYGTFVSKRELSIQAVLGKNYSLQGNRDIQTMTREEATAYADRIDRYLAIMEAEPVPPIGADFEHERNALLELVVKGVRAHAAGDISVINGLGVSAPIQQQRVMNEARGLRKKCGTIPIRLMSVYNASPSQRDGRTGLPLTNLSLLSVDSQRQGSRTPQCCSARLARCSYQGRRSLDMMNRDALAAVHTPS